MNEGLYKFDTEEMERYIQIQSLFQQEGINPVPLKSRSTVQMLGGLMSQFVKDKSLLIVPFLTADKNTDTSTYLTLGPKEYVSRSYQRTYHFQCQLPQTLY